MTSTTLTWRLPLAAGLANLLAIPAVYFIIVLVLDPCDGAGPCFANRLFGIGIITLMGPFGAVLAFAATLITRQKSRHRTELATESLALGLLAYSVGSVVVWIGVLLGPSAPGWLPWFALAYFVLGPPATVSVVCRRSAIGTKREEQDTVP